MKELLICFAATAFSFAIFGSAFAQTIEISLDQNVSQSSEEFLGLNLRPEIREIVKEIEHESEREIYRKFVELDDFMLGSS